MAAWALLVLGQVQPFRRAGGKCLLNKLCAYAALCCLTLLCAHLLCRAIDVLQASESKIAFKYEVLVMKWC